MKLFMIIVGGYGHVSTSNVKLLVESDDVTVENIRENILNNKYEHKKLFSYSVNEIVDIVEISGVDDYKIIVGDKLEEKYYVINYRYNDLSLTAIAFTKEKSNVPITKIYEKASKYNRIPDATLSFLSVNEISETMYNEFVNKGEAIVV